MAGTNLTCSNAITEKPLYDPAELEREIRAVALRIIGIVEELRGDEARRRALRYAATLAPAAKGAES